MINEFAFIAGLYIAGLGINTFLCKQLPGWVGITTAFLIGCINWVIVSLLLWLITGRIIAWVAIIFITCEAIVLVIAAIKKIGMLQFSRRPFLFFVFYTVFFCGCAILFLNFNLTHATRDTLTYVMMGKSMEFSGISNLIWGPPSSIGYFTSVMQTPSRFLGVGYLQSILPMISTSFALFLFWAGVNCFRQSLGKWKAVLLSILFVTFMYSSMIMQYMFSYIHSNCVSGILLFASLFCYYSYHEDPTKKSWLALGSFFILGFCLLRVESTIFALLLLILISKYLNLSFENCMHYLFPCVVFSLVTDISYLFLGLRFLSKSLLDVSDIFGLLVVALFTACYFVFYRSRLLDKYIKRNVHIILSFLFTASLVIAFSTKFSEMLTSLLANTSSIFVMGGWGSSWMMIILCLVFLWGKVKNSYFAFLQYFIPFNYFIILLLSYFHKPYLEKWSGSGNRLFAQLFFVCALYIFISLIHLFRENGTDQSKLSISELSE